MGRNPNTKGHNSVFDRTKTVNNLVHNTNIVLNDKEIDMEDDVHEIADRQHLLALNKVTDTPEEITTVFQIMTNDDQEYYTEIPPVISIDGIWVSKVIRKGIVSQKILTKTIEQYYSIEVEEMTLPLDEGIILRNVSIEKLPWLKTTEEEAAASLKDEVLVYYQNVVPELLNKVTKLETIMQQRQQGYNRSDLHID
jgi:hypothetical protein